MKGRKRKKGGDGDRKCETVRQRHQKNQNDDIDKRTAEKLAQQYKVSKPTIERDAQFARTVDTVVKPAGNGANQDFASY